MVTGMADHSQSQPSTPAWPPKGAGESGEVSHLRPGSAYGSGSPQPRSSAGHGPCCVLCSELLPPLHSLDAAMPDCGKNQKTSMGMMEGKASPELGKPTLTTPPILCVCDWQRRGSSHRQEDIAVGSVSLIHPYSCEG